MNLAFRVLLCVLVSSSVLEANPQLPLFNEALEFVESPEDFVASFNLEVDGELEVFFIQLDRALNGEDVSEEELLENLDQLESRLRAQQAYNVHSGTVDNGKIRIMNYQLEVLIRAVVIAKLSEIDPKQISEMPALQHRIKMILLEAISVPVDYQISDSTTDVLPFYGVMRRSEKLKAMEDRSFAFQVLAYGDAPIGERAISTMAIRLAAFQGLLLYLPDHLSLAEYLHLKKSFNQFFIEVCARVNAQLSRRLAERGSSLQAGNRGLSQEQKLQLKVIEIALPLSSGGEEMNRILSKNFGDDILLLDLNVRFIVNEQNQTVQIVFKSY